MNGLKRLRIYGGREDETIQLNKSLHHRILEAFLHLGVPPNWDVIRDGYREEFREIPHLLHIEDSLDVLEREGYLDTANHVLRVTLDSFAVSDFLGISDPAYTHHYQTFTLAALKHDTGKFVPDLEDVVEKIGTFTPEDGERMKRHVEVSAGVCLDTDIQAVVGLHHFWQKNSYGPGFEISRTEETDHLSKLLALIDFHDSASTRANSRTGGKLLPSGSVKNLLLSEYGNLPLFYRGDQLPQSDSSGEELILKLYDAGIFGRKNPLNPYPTPFSFLWRARKLERTLAQTTAFVKHYSDMKRWYRIFPSNILKLS